MRETVTRQRPTVSQDGYGDDELTWTDPDELEVFPDAVEPVSSVEDNDGRQAVITGYRIYFRNSQPDIAAADRVVLRGTTWQVVGMPADWRGSSLTGLVVELRAVTG